MPIAFLLVTLFGATLTLNAYRPLARRGRMSIFSFAAGWLVSELPVHHVFWQLVFTIGFVWAGALTAWQGQLGMGITAISWLALLYLVIQANGAQAFVGDAIAATLGTDYATRLAPSMREPVNPHLTMRRLLQPFARVHGEVERLVNIQYDPRHGRRGMLDIYRRREGGAKRPVLLQVHGGAWIIGSKDDQGLPLMNHLAANGWICVAINYRLSPRASWPAHIIDVKRAIVWVKDHIAEYGGDPDFVVITGGSAGGHLSSLAALTANDPTWQPGFADRDTSVQGCVSFYGVYDFTNRKGIGSADLLGLLEERVFKKKLEEDREAFDRASPISRVHAGAPPFFVIHGSNDTLVPVAEARLFVEMLRGVSRQPVVYAELPGAQHAFEVFVSVRTMHTVQGVERFVAALYSAYLEREKPAVRELEASGEEMMA